MPIRKFNGNYCIFLSRLSYMVYLMTMACFHLDKAKSMNSEFVYLSLSKRSYGTLLACSQEKCHLLQIVLHAGCYRD